MDGGQEVYLTPIHKTCNDSSNCADAFGRSRDVRFGAMGLPSFHIIGLLLQLTYSLYTGQGVAVYTPQWPAPPVVVHPQNVYEVAKLAKCTALFALPSFVQVRIIVLCCATGVILTPFKGMVPLSRDG